jgi:hypothetical protein
MISEKEIVRMVSVREGKTFKTERQVTKGPISCISTTTRSRVQIDDENRQLSIFTDDSPEQTGRILLARLEQVPPIADDDLEDWYGVQAVLAERAKLPFTFGKWRKPVIQFVWSRGDLRLRRYYPAFEDLCKTVTLLRSLRISADEISEQKRLDVTFTDFAIATFISNAAFSQSLSHPNEDDAELQKSIARISARKSGAGVAVLDLATEWGISTHQAYRRLKEAHARKVIQRANRSERGNRKLYLPSPPIQMLPDPEEIFRTLGRDHVTFRHPITGKPVRYRK